GWAEKAVRASEPYGDALVRDMLLRVTERLAGKADYAAAAVPFAQRLEKMLDPKKDPVPYQKRVLEVVAGALEKAGKADEAKAVRERNEKLLYVTATPFAGRKGSSDRAVLAEVFTNVHNEEAVAAELTAAAVGKAYRPSEVIV